ncbi:MAG: SGNH/GDSL hydrolase family protein [Methanothrix sp.]|jgi:Lysophospholipase L1 and related esterases|uniref:Lipolytic enzyme, G-D-S-L family n=1 Tax=Methanothrix thermoacetophila (strain DSM 6194 / JCM 14653 / NBRC 101360 / PT) TaxID=349307 RepID=A0B5L6_METTP|nr:MULTISPECIES: SGNH/GDSL hydrolase family protein [Methanothrix]ABK13990.1 lipolytic enzyme, G-D-S-L family [Methanothrix thermoacetophila PT]MBC7079833.1 SGNH/GDSL hydrolase family protein [Methanothrix sp.]NPU87984.1 SGNH/GDSL hydrolase family protein [Methanothrix sp.]
MSQFTRRTVNALRSGCDVVIVAFGDSITAGYAVRHGFPYFWKQALQEKYPDARIEMHNEGVSGDTTRDGLARLEHSVLYHRPDLVTINFGINDAAYGIGLDEFRANLSRMVEIILSECCSEIILLSSQPLLTPYYDKLVLDYYSAIGEVAAAMGVGFVDVYAAWMVRVRSGMPLESLVLPGLDHPNEDGYRIIAEELMKLF